MKDRTIWTGVIGIIVLQLLVYAAIIAVAIHFIRKLW